MPEQALFNHNQIISFICGIADECFRDVYVHGKYLNVILCLASALFSCVGRETISHFQNEDNRESLTFPQIGAFFIPLPSIEEQRQILDFIAGKINSIEDVIGNINKKRDTPNEYKNSLIPSVITDQTNVRKYSLKTLIRRSSSSKLRIQPNLKNKHNYNTRSNNDCFRKRRKSRFISKPIF